MRRSAAKMCKELIFERKNSFAKYTQGVPHRSLSQKGCSSGARGAVTAHTTASHTAQSTSATHVQQHNLLAAVLTENCDEFLEHLPRRGRKLA